MYYSKLFKFQNTECFRSRYTSPLISTLKLSKACGHGRISPKLLRDSEKIVAPILTKICNQSINTGTFPDNLKTAIISPLYKNGSNK